MFSNETQEKPPVPPRSGSNISGSVRAKQNSAVTLASVAITTVSNLFVTPPREDATSANEAEQKAMNYGTFSLRK